MQSLVSSVLKLHSVPQHVAFIMDGNRRYAERNHMRKIEGHLFGYQRLIDALEWCFDLGIKCVSVYAFSLDNYKRSPQEVETLMQLAEEKLRHMIKVLLDVDSHMHALQQIDTSFGIVYCGKMQHCSVFNSY